MTDNNDCFDDLMNKLDGDEEGFQLFSDMISLAMSGHLGDRLDIDGVYVEDDEFEQAICRYLRNIRLRNHANRYLKPKPVF